jgi:hypothetical protein
MKECFKCKVEKPLSDYYKHKQMADGHLNKCKECTKNDSTKHRGDNLEKIREYDRKRGNRQSKDYLMEYRASNPNKYKAHNIVNNAKGKGQIFSEPCEVCGEDKTVAHHDDYLKPLNVRWLCQAHHKQWHAENGEGKNG